MFDAVAPVRATWHADLREAAAKVAPMSPGEAQALDGGGASMLIRATGGPEGSIKFEAWSNA